MIFSVLFSVRPQLFPGELPWRGHDVLHVQNRQVFDVSHLTKVVLNGLYMNLPYLQHRHLFYVPHTLCVEFF